MRKLFNSKWKVTQEFGVNEAYYKQFGLKGHEGGDYIPTGTVWDVFCLEDGVVVKDENNAKSGAYGDNVTVWHPTINRATQYCHFKENYVNLGDKVKKEDIEIEVLNIPISDFELSVRSRNCLERMNIKTLADLTRVSELELLSYKNFGETSLTEVTNILNQKGLRLGQAVDETRHNEIFIDDTGRNKDNLLKTISGMDLSKHCRKVIEKMGIETIGELVSKTETELLQQKGFKQADIDEIKDQLYELGLELYSGNNKG